MEELKEQIWEMINTAVEAAGLLLTYAETGKKEMFANICDGLQEMLTVIVGVAEQVKECVPVVSLPAMSISSQVSLMRIQKYFNENPEKAVQKIRFEFIPLIEEMRMDYYYWVMVYPNKDAIRKYYEEDIYTYFRNPYLEEAEKTGVYKYDVSIVVIAFNKLEYTRACIESLKLYLPKTFSYELILVNHGSTDGTKEYFESLEPDKQIDIAVNGGGIFALNRCLEGRYTIGISNDVLVTENALDNLYSCITRDEKIAWAVPTTPNVSNYQTIPLEYSDLKGMYTAASQNNILDFSRHEQRVRLCNPIDIYDNRIAWKTKLFGGFFLKETFSFPDDSKALVYRRAGYKMFLAKDAYCYHFGSVTLRDEVKDNNYYLQGRQQFMQIYGVDPWGVGNCYDNELFQQLSLDQTEVRYILGINCGLGSNSLKLRECLKETGKYIEKIELTNCTNDVRFIEDLAGISDQVYQFDSWEDLKEIEQEKQYSYIVWECDEEIKEMDFKEALEIIKTRLTDYGEVLIRCQDTSKIGIAEKTLNMIKIIKMRRGAVWMQCKGK